MFESGARGERQTSASASAVVSRSVSRRPSSTWHHGSPATPCVGLIVGLNRGGNRTPSERGIRQDGGSQRQRRGGQVRGRAWPDSQGCPVGQQALDLAGNGSREKAGPRLGSVSLCDARRGAGASPGVSSAGAQRRRSSGGTTSDPGAGCAPPVARTDLPPGCGGGDRLSPSDLAQSEVRCAVGGVASRLRVPDPWRQAGRRDHLGGHPACAAAGPIWNTKRETAQRTRQRISAVMKAAVAAGHRADNPAGDALAAALPRADRHSGTSARCRTARWPA